MIEYESEPVPGLPGLLPRGEAIIWQGSPDPRLLARTAFHTRAVAAYFGVLAVIAAGSALWQGIRSPADLIGTGLTIAGGAVCVGLLRLIAWGCARTTIYTLTDKRIVLRFGMALPKCINLPLGIIGNVALRKRTAGAGDLAIAITGPQRLGYAALWPHARAWHYSSPQPMLRALPRVDDIATLIARACLSVQTGGRVVPIEAASRRSEAAEQAEAA